MTTGARRGELCGLRWSRIDLDTAVLTYRKGVAQDGAEVWEKDTKTSSQRSSSCETVAFVEGLRRSSTWFGSLARACSASFAASGPAGTVSVR
jgi:integrase